MKLYHHAPRADIQSILTEGLRGSERLTDDTAVESLPEEIEAFDYHDEDDERNRERCRTFLEVLMEERRPVGTPPRDGSVYLNPDSETAREVIDRFDYGCVEVDPQVCDEVQFYWSRDDYAGIAFQELDRIARDAVEKRALSVIGWIEAYWQSVMPFHVTDSEPPASLGPRLERVRADDYIAVFTPDRIPPHALRDCTADIEDTAPEG